MDAAAVDDAEKAPPPRPPHHGAWHVPRRDRDIGTVVERAKEAVEDVDRDVEIRVDERDRIALRRHDARADRTALAAMLEAEVAVLEMSTRKRLHRVGERAWRRVGRTVVDHDDLAWKSTRYEELRACGEARR